MDAGGSSGPFQVIQAVSQTRGSGSELSRQVEADAGLDWRAGLRLAWSGMAEQPEFHHRMPAVWMITAAFSFASMGALAHAVGPRCDWLVIALIRILCSFVFSVALAWVGGARLGLRAPPPPWVRRIARTLRP